MTYFIIYDNLSVSVVNILQKRQKKDKAKADKENTEMSNATNRINRANRVKKEAVQKFIHTLMTQQHVKMPGIATDLQESYGMVQHVIGGFKDTPRIRQKLAGYFGFSNWGDLEQQAAGWWEYTATLIPEGAQNGAQNGAQTAARQRESE
ncbi:hypothetical protein P0082_07805 [Candidatus Haliotispira prima]|uniref:Uncharacterized protein n=1 Tax=Candidatus Haliotispira prima TaxID=3034016 RepID=A0ABY8MGC5_9SPIO|nr:hypothetical protein P0082_07805 [Candidatus Haliotispira prima]